MSLKARLEAVIYAAEEPVTLTQLAALFASEALEEKQTRQAAEVAVEAQAAAASEPPLAAEIAQEGSEAVGEDAEAGNSSEPGQATEAGEATEASAEVLAAEEKRAARQRDREIREELRRILQELIDEYANSDRGMEIREIAGGYRVGTKPEYHDAVRTFVKSLKPPIKLSLQALETLAAIAYKQPVTAPEVSEIRGVDSAGVIGSLISRKLITTAGRKQVIGRPILYKTTKEFLLRFGLKDLNELPSMEEFEKMAGELSDPESGDLPFAQNEIAAVEEASGSEFVEDGENESAVTSPEAAATEPGGNEEAEAEYSAEIEVADESEEEEDLPGIFVEEQAVEEAESDSNGSREDR